MQTFDRVAAALARRFGVAGTEDARGLPPAPGAYLLLLALPAKTLLDITAFRDRALPPGIHLYAGSARGPGGLRARLSRHLRPDKKPHWHIDLLTVAAARVVAFPFPGVHQESAPSAHPAFTECALIETLLESGRYHHPLPGFGSSDCRNCASHLLAPN